MNPLETVTYLRAHGLPALCEAHAIKARRHGVYPNLVQLKYSQSESSMGERIVQECRGLILDEANDWAVVAYPFSKFFNAAEGHAAAIDWPTARVYEKLDGSLMTVYAYRGQWHVASSGLPDAAGPTGGTGRGTFADLFWRVWAELGYGLPPAFPDTCFMFELMTPDNRIVCRQACNRIVLIGARDVESLTELAPEPIAARYGWECVRSLPLATLDDCLSAAALIDPMDGEGYVVRDAAFNRIKVKSPQYVALAHMKDGMTLRRMLEIVRANESSEFLAHFPEYRADYDRVRAAFDQLCAFTEFVYGVLKSIPDRKSFAMGATHTPVSAAMFALRDGKAGSAREFFARCTLPALERMIGIDLNESATQPETAHV